jgi:hypothetical protein
MSVWSLKKRVFSFEDCRSKSLSTARRRRGKKRRDVKHWFALANSCKTTRCQALVCARQPPQNLRSIFPPADFPWWIMSAITDTQSLVSGACQTTAYEQQGRCLASLLPYVWRSRRFEDPRSDLGVVMRILIYSANFAPEPTGIGKYSGEMARRRITRHGR